MNANRLGWLLVGAILVVSGLQHVVTRQIFGRVRVSDTPIMEGWTVAVIGLAECCLGAFLLWRYWRGRD